MTANGLAKLLEELGELSQVAAKRLAYFHTSTHPDGAGDLNERMENEMADVSAACAFVIQKFRLNGERIGDRAALKLHLFQQWDADPDNGAECFHAPGPCVPPGWKIERRDSKPFKLLNITAPNGYSSTVASHDRNPMNVLYMLAEALLEKPHTKENP